MEIKTYTVNLDLPPDQRWSFLKNHISEINDLLDYYLNDLQDVMPFMSLIKEYRDTYISIAHQEEMAFISSISKFNAEEVLMANLYYDILKLYFGCTAFAYFSKGQIFHARNLDWHTDNALLSRHSLIFDFHKNNKSVFKSIGWPGFIGVLSGTKTNCFSVTLNAVLSDDPPSIAYPISFLIRDVLTEEHSFQGALKRLADTPILCDCLLLLSGIKESEMVVVERSPKRSVIRDSDTNYIVVTNDYKKAEIVSVSSGDSILHQTSCGRYDQASHLLSQKGINKLSDCMDILKDPKVIMNITVQQMVFNNHTGVMHVEKRVRQ